MTAVTDRRRFARLCCRACDDPTPRGGGGFRISAGGGWDDNTLKVSAPVSELVRRYRPELAPLVPASAGTIHGEATGSSFAPYLGLGWGSAGRGGRWGLSFDLGVIYQGSPEVDLTTDLNLGVPIPAAAARPSTPPPPTRSSAWSASSRTTATTRWWRSASSSGPELARPPQTRRLTPSLRVGSNTPARGGRGLRWRSL